MSDDPNVPDYIVGGGEPVKSKRRQLPPMTRSATPYWVAHSRRYPGR